MYRKHAVLLLGISNELRIGAEQGPAKYSQCAIIDMEIPKHIQVPPQIKINVWGKLKTFEAIIDLNSSPSSLCYNVYYFCQSFGGDA